MKNYLLLVFFLIFYLNSFSQRLQYYPAHNWDKVPVAFHFGNKEALSEDEIKFIISKSNLIVLEKGHGGNDFKFTEEGSENDAKRLKHAHPDMKVIYYWNTFLDYSMYKAHKTYESHPEWWLKKKNGELDYKINGLKRYDLSNRKVRKWWVSEAKKNVVEGSHDGIFLDALIQVKSSSNIKLWGQDKYDSIQNGLKNLIKETREAIGEDKLIFYNGIRSSPGNNIGNNFPDYTDAIMIEHFGIINSKSKESMLFDIQQMEKAGKSGKIVIFKGWPNHYWLEKDFMAKSLDEKQKISKRNITFPLAAFLVGAQKYSYFIYSWGYRMEMGCLEWYSEFDKSIGKPLGDMVLNGWELSREFENVSVNINLETKEASIKPRK
tara:strand:- start:2616 stop:3749 length:1134 start_codon:yes stop_codon:yes gene_type:complete